MKKQGYFLFVICLLFQASYAQDTLQVNFKFGSSRIVKAEKERLKIFLEQVELFQLDSVQFIGMTDSVGSMEANLLLSQKRANHVKSYAESYFPKKIKRSTIALGESIENAMARRVLLILHYQPSFSVDSIELKAKGNISEDCVYIDYTLLNTSRLKTVKRRRKEYVYVEFATPANFYPVPDYFRTIDFNKHYYGDTNDVGQLVVKRIKWRRKLTGEDWWRSYRLSTLVPKENFDKFQIFYLEKPPCNDCSLRSDEGWRKPYLSQMRHIDNFVSNNFQFKRSFWSRRKFKLRTPREFVDTNALYFAQKSSNEALNWYKRKSKKNQKYYFAKLRLNSKNLYSIYRDFNYCENPIKDSAQNNLFRLSCGGHFIKSPCSFYSRKIMLEAGANYSSGIFTAYTGLNYSFNKNPKKLSSNLFLGLNSMYHPLAQIRFRYSLYQFDLGTPIRSVCFWAKPSLGKTNYWSGKLYGGVEVQADYQGNVFALTPNINTGILFSNCEINKRFTGIYLQYNQPLVTREKFFDLSSPSIRLGLNFRLLKDKSD